MRKLIPSAFLIWLSTSALSQAGSVDSTFGTNGTAELVPANHVLQSITAQADGKIACTGYYGETEDYDALLVRYTSTGALDKTFSKDGLRIEADLSTSYRRFVAVQQDGKVLIAGTAFFPDFEHPELGSTDIVIIRYQKNGKRDSTFGNNGKVRTDIGRIVDGKPFPSYDQTNSIALQRDGSILVAASSYDYSNQDPDNSGDPSPYLLAVVRYNVNGTIQDMKRVSEDFAAPPDLSVKVTAYQDSGFVLGAVKKDSSVFLYSTRFGERIIKHPSGDWRYGSVFQTHHILRSGKIVVASYGISDLKTPHYLAVLNADGTSDTGFSGDGYLELSAHATSITSGGDDKIIVGGGRIARYHANGTLDQSFGANGVIDTFSYQIVAYGNRLYQLANNIQAYLLSTAPRYLKVNLYGNFDPYVNKEWNNWSNLKNRHFNNFYYSDSTASTISAIMSNRNGVIDNRTNYGSGMAPAGVLRHSSYSIGSRTITFSGLSVLRKYSIELYGSRNAYSDNNTMYTINGISKTIATYRNFTSKAVFTNLTPDAKGQLVLTISSTKTYNYLNGFILTESYSTGTVAATLPTTVAAAPKTAPGMLQIKVFPNPAAHYFTLQLLSRDTEPVQLRVMDAAGLVVEIKRNVATNAVLSIGHVYKPGVYYVEAVQKSQRKLVRLVKVE